MKVHFQQSGGFAGMMRGCTLDTDAMDPGEAGTLEALVRQSSIRGMTTAQDPGARDVFAYEIDIEAEGETHHLTVDELSLTPEVVPLLEFLRTRARPQSP